MNNTRERSYLASVFVIMALISGCATEVTSPANLPSSRPDGEPAALSLADESNYLQALQILAAGDLESALREIDRLARKHPAEVGIWINLATAYYQAGELEKALQSLQQARELRADIAAISNLYGLIAVEQGQYTEAERHYRRAIEIDDNHALAHYNLALLYDLFYQNLAGAVRHYERYLASIGSEDPATTAWVAQLKRSLPSEAQ